jgi:hypothetical protein
MMAITTSSSINVNASRLFTISTSTCELAVQTRSKEEF